MKIKIADWIKDLICLLIVFIAICYFFPVVYFTVPRGWIRTLELMTIVVIYSLVLYRFYKRRIREIKED